MQVIRDPNPWPRRSKRGAPTTDLQAYSNAVALIFLSAPSFFMPTPICHFCSFCQPLISLFHSNKGIWETILQPRLQTAWGEKEIWNSCKWAVVQFSRAVLISLFLGLVGENKDAPTQFRKEERPGKQIFKSVLKPEWYNYRNAGRAI